MFKVVFLTIFAASSLSFGSQSVCNFTLEQLDYGKFSQKVAGAILKQDNFRILRLLYDRYGGEINYLWTDQYEFFAAMFKPDVGIKEKIDLLRNYDLEQRKRRTRRETDKDVLRYQVQLWVKGRAPRESSYAEVNESDPDKYIRVTHGGGWIFFHEFLMGTKEGIVLEMGGTGIWLTAENPAQSKARDKFYAHDNAYHHFDLPATASFEIQRKFLDPVASKPNYVAALRKEFVNEARNITITNLITGKSENWKDVAEMKSSLSSKGALRPQWKNK